MKCFFIALGRPAPVRLSTPVKPSRAAKPASRYSPDPTIVEMAGRVARQWNRLAILRELLSRNGFSDAEAKRTAVCLACPYYTTHAPTQWPEVSTARAVRAVVRSLNRFIHLAPWCSLFEMPIEPLTAAAGDLKSMFSTIAPGQQTIGCWMAGEN